MTAPTHRSTPSLTFDEALALLGVDRSTGPSGATRAYYAIMSTQGSRLSRAEAARLEEARRLATDKRRFDV